MAKRRIDNKPKSYAQKSAANQRKINRRKRERAKKFQKAASDVKEIKKRAGNSRNRTDKEVRIITEYARGRSRIKHGK